MHLNFKLILKERFLLLRNCARNHFFLSAVSASFLSGWCSGTRRSARTLRTRQRSTNSVSSAHHYISREPVNWLTQSGICALNCRANEHYLNSWVKAGADGYPPEFTVDPVKAAYAAKLASGDTAYDDLKKMCDGMLATKDDRWSLTACLVREPGCVAPASACTALV